MNNFWDLFWVIWPKFGHLATVLFRGFQSYFLPTHRNKDAQFKFKICIVILVFAHLRLKHHFRKKLFTGTSLKRTGICNIILLIDSNSFVIFSFAKWPQYEPTVTLQSKIFFHLSLILVQKENDWLLYFSLLSIKYRYAICPNVNLKIISFKIELNF
jgi:hypothetical protein